MTVIALIVAAGRGSRAKQNGPKQWVPLAGRRVIDWTIEAFAQHPEIDDICLVLHPDDVSLAPQGIAYCHGGADRETSVRNGLEHLQAIAPTIVLIHDAARPLVSASLISNIIADTRRYGAAAPGVAVSDTLWRAQSQSVQDILPREGLFRAQTPQGFSYPLIYEAHARHGGARATDDVALALNSGHQVHITAGQEDNFKLTYPEDFARAARLLGQRQ